jgi:hypothetical protein
MTDTQEESFPTVTDPLPFPLPLAMKRFAANFANETRTIIMELLGAAF